MLVKANIEFIDIHTLETIKEGSIFETTFERYQEMLCNGIKISPIAIGYRGNKKKHGPKIIIYQKLLYCVGGIETWDYNLAKTFEDRDITFVFSEADNTQFIELSRYANVLMDDAEHRYECDIFVNANYDGSDILLPRVKAKRVYQTIHSDFKALKEIGGWSNFTLKISDRTDKIFSASETAQKGLKEGFGYDSIVLHNILAEPETERPMVFISLTRASEEKGIGRCIEMARRFRKEGKNFIWLLCSTLETGDSDNNQLAIEAIKSIPEFIQVQPQLYSRKLLHFADYLVQMSDTEAYCYSMREALALKVPVLVTPFPEATKIVKNGKNGYVINFDLSNLDTEKIFSEKPEFDGYSEPVDALWMDFLEGKL